MKIKEIIQLLEEENKAPCGHPLDKSFWLSNKLEDMGVQYRKCEVCGEVWIVNPGKAIRPFDSNPVNKGGT